jgi:hypothetical protein
VDHEVVWAESPENWIYRLPMSLLKGPSSLQSELFARPIVLEPTSAKLDARMVNPVDPGQIVDPVFHKTVHSHAPEPRLE